MKYKLFFNEQPGYEGYSVRGHIISGSPGLYGGTFFFFFKCLIYLDPRTREKYKRNKLTMGNRPINP